MPKRFFITLGLVTALAAALTGQSLRGSRSSVDLMYSSARTRDLVFLNTPADIYHAAMQGALSLILFTQDLELDKVMYPFVLPNTRRFADSLARAYHVACGERLVVTSGARPADEQPRNASPKSVHPTGMAVDFRKPRSPACLGWLRSSLLALEDRHVIEATEERRPAHFHVAVLRQATEPPVAIVASSRDSGTAATNSGAAVHPASTRDAGHTRRGSAYRVRAGDNLSTIARRHGTTAKRLQVLNHLRTSHITPGQTLALP